MFPKKQRLSGQDIQRLMRRGRKWYGGTLAFLAAPQRRGANYSQWSVQIPVKLDKRATMRNALKRSVLTYVREHEEEILPDEKHYKVFVMVNKQAITSLRQLIATSSKTDILQQRMSSVKKDFSMFARKLGNGSPRGGNS